MYSFWSHHGTMPAEGPREILMDQQLLAKLLERLQRLSLPKLSWPPSLAAVDFGALNCLAIGIISLLNVISLSGGFWLILGRESFLNFVYAALIAITLQAVMISLSVIVARYFAEKRRWARLPTKIDDEPPKARLKLLLVALTCSMLVGICVSYVEFFTRIQPAPFVVDPRTSLLNTQKELIKSLGDDVRVAREAYLARVSTSSAVTDWLTNITRNERLTHQTRPDWEQRIRSIQPSLANQLSDLQKRLDAAQSERSDLLLKAADVANQLQDTEQRRSRLVASCTDPKKENCPDENVLRELSRQSKELSRAEVFIASRVRSLDDDMTKLNASKETAAVRLQTLSSSSIKDLDDRLADLEKARKTFTDDPSEVGYQRLADGCKLLSSLLSLDPEAKNLANCESAGALRAIGTGQAHSSYVQAFRDKCTDDRALAGALDLEDLYQRIESNLSSCIWIARNAGAPSNQRALNGKLFEVYPGGLVQRAFEGFFVQIGAARTASIAATGVHLALLGFIFLAEVRRADMAARQAAEGLLPFLPPVRTIDRAGEEHLIQLGSVVVERLEIENFRNLGRLTISLDRKSTLAGNWTCIAGTNGAGKSSILQALCLVLLGEKYAAELGGELLKRLVGTNSKTARVTATCKVGRNTHTLDIPLSRGGIDESILRSHTEYWSMPAIWMSIRNQVFVSYGATRNISERRDTRYSGLSRIVQRQMTLYDPVAQVAGSDILLTSESDRDKNASKTFELLLQKILGDEVKPASQTADRRFGFVSKGATISAVDLPDGYRSTAAWLADLCVAWHETAPAGTVRSTNPEDISGIVLIDELDLHLHVSLQREIVPRLRAALPKVQFVVTTHSPMILSCFDREELVVLDAAEEGGVRTLDRQLFGLSMDEIFEYLMGTKPNSPVFSEIAARNRDEAAKLVYQSADRSQADAEVELRRREELLRRLSSR